ncbi:MAG TPA: hypothetical protein PKY82_33130, partial [Pyrinomonadaceae bacterium]|nr:hypothetical protein [Pyrinomonadaceae bacterium]
TTSIGEPTNSPNISTSPEVLNEVPDLPNVPAELPDLLPETDNSTSALLTEVEAITPQENLTEEQIEVEIESVNDVEIVLPWEREEANETAEQPAENKTNEDDELPL